MGKRIIFFTISMPRTKQIDNKTIKTLEKAQSGHDLSKQEYIRVQAVLMKKKGFTVEQIIQVNGKNRTTIEGWITAFNQHGVAGLKTVPQSPRFVKFKTDDKQKLKTLVNGHKPTEYGYTEDFWSISILKDFVKTKFKVVYKSERSYQDLFAYCGFSYQKAEYIDHRKDETDSSAFKVRLRKRLKKGAFSMSW